VASVAHTLGAAWPFLIPVIIPVMIVG